MKGGTSNRVFLAAVLTVSSRLWAGFASTETYLPAVGRVPGKNGAEFYTTVWATNLTGAPQTFTFEFLKTGQSNPSPASFHDSLAPGETKVYENVVESKLGLSDALGAARILSSGEIFVSERIYNQNPGDDLGNTEGLFFAGVPKTFSISSGESASIQGIDEGSSENFRYNFALIETGGGSPTVDVQVFDGSGTMLGQKSYPLLPYEHVQPSVDDVVPGIATTNARITATVTGGSGSVLLAGAQVANESQDSSGFEMTFRDDLLGGGGGGGTAGVTSLNGLTGALTLKPGSGISITPSGSQISIAYTGGGGSGLTAVTHDASLAGEGTGSSPLSIANGQVVRSVNGLRDNLTLAAGSNVTITPSGSTLTIASSGGGGGGGLTLPFAGTTSSGNPAISVTNTGSGSGIQGTTSGSGGNTAGVSGTCPTNVLCAGVQGTGQTGLAAHGTATGLYAESSATNSVALYAINDASSGYIARFENGFGTDRVTIDTKGNLVANSGGGTGVGISGTGNNTGVSGIGTDGVIGNGSFAGVYGQGTVAGAWAIFANGTLAATGMKSFVEPHPSNPTKEVRYVCLEGPESGTYFRGTARIVNGIAEIAVPEDFRIVSSDRGLTVQLTPIGAPATLWIAAEDLKRITVRGSSDVEFHYLVNGVRKAFEDFEPVSENRDFVPRSPRDPRLTTGLPSESLRRLEASGILNADGTINIDTAHRLGWDQQESWKTAVAAKEAIR